MSLFSSLPELCRDHIARFLNPVEVSSFQATGRDGYLAFLLPSIWRHQLDSRASALGERLQKAQFDRPDYNLISKKLALMVFAQSGSKHPCATTADLAGRDRLTWLLNSFDAGDKSTRRSLALLYAEELASLICEKSSNAVDPSGPAGELIKYSVCYLNSGAELCLKFPSLLYWLLASPGGCGLVSTLLPHLHRVGFDVAYVDSEGQNFLHAAARYGDFSDPRRVNLVKQLLDLGVDPCQRDKQGRLPGYPIEGREVFGLPQPDDSFFWNESVKAIREYQARPYPRTTPARAVEALQNGKVDVLRAIAVQELSGCIYISESLGYWPLVEVLQWGHLECAQVLTARLDDDSLFRQHTTGMCTNPLYRGILFGHRDREKSEDLALFVGRLLNRCQMSTQLEPQQQRECARGLASSLFHSFIAGAFSADIFRQAFGGYCGTLLPPRRMDAQQLLRLSNLCPTLLGASVLSHGPEEVSLLEFLIDQSPEIRSHCRPYVNALVSITMMTGRSYPLKGVWEAIFSGKYREFSTLSSIGDLLCRQLLAVTLGRPWGHEDRSHTTWLHLFCAALVQRPEWTASRDDLRALLTKLAACGANFSVQDSEGRSPLHSYLVRVTQRECNSYSDPFVEFALRHFRRPLHAVVEGHEGNTLLHHVLQYGEDPERVASITWHLLAMGHSASVRNRAGRTPQELAELAGNQTVLRMLAPVEAPPKRLKVTSFEDPIDTSRFCDHRELLNKYSL